MFKQIEFFLAFKYLKAKRKEKFISITALFSLIGIMLGVATLIVVMSVMNGFREELISKVIGINAHITIFPRKNSQNKYENIISEIENIENIKVVNAIIDGQGIFLFNEKTAGGMVKGIKYNDLKNKKEIFNNLDKKELKNFDNENGIIIGRELAIALNVRKNDEIKIISPSSNNTIFGTIPKIKTYKVLDIFKSGLYEYDSMTVFIPFKIAQIQFDKKESASAIEIFVKDVNKTADTFIEIENILNEKYYNFGIVDWKTANSSFIEALNVERNVMFMILSLIILIAAFNIISSLTMLVMDKNKQIALLKTLGMKNNGIMRIFFICGSFIGFIGTFTGSLIGIIFSINIQKIQLFIENLFKVKLFNPSVYLLTNLPSKIMLKDVLLVVFISMLFSFLATLYPAKKASKINPADTLRYE